MKIETEKEFILKQIVTINIILDKTIDCIDHNEQNSDCLLSLKDLLKNQLHSIQAFYKEKKNEKSIWN